MHGLMPVILEAGLADVAGRGRGRPRAGVTPGSRWAGCTCGIAISHTDPTSIPCAKAETERRKVVMPGEGRELYRSPNGDRWLLIRETLSDRVLVRHEPNPPALALCTLREATST